MSITINEPDGFYSTTDTALAAWLHSQGIKLYSTDTNHFPSTFHFKDEPPIQELVHDYQVGNAIGNVANFYRSYRRLLSIVKSGH